MSLRLIVLTSLIAFVVLATTGCSDRVTLESVDRATQLTYSCANPTPRARSEAQKQLVRQFAARIASEVADSVERFPDLIAAYVNPDVAPLEQLVAEYMCEHGELALIVRVPVFPEPGSAARDFELPLLTRQGQSSTETLRLSEQRGHLVLLDFWASWCPPCIETYPEKVQIAREYGPRGLVVLGIVHRDPATAALAWLESHGGIEYPFLLDPDSKVARLYGVWGIPRTFLIDRDGMLLWHRIGTADFRAQLDSII